MKESRRGKLPTRIKVLYGVVAALLVVVLVFGTGILVVNGFLGKIKYDTGESDVIYDDVFETIDLNDLELESLEVIDETDIVFRDVEDDVKGRTEEGVFNILLMGEDHSNSGDYRGNTDAMIVATINVNDHSVKLTSFMRDMYVYIPGYTENKLNSVYAKGGIQLVYDTFSANFDLDLDGYFIVNFDSFESVIDELGGVSLTLSYEEANYLNSTNYISDPSQRYVTAGEQIMNGNQALGYARIRYIGNNDYERTERQRNVLTAVFNAFRSKNLIEMTSVLDKVLPYIKTDLTTADMISIATKALSANLKDIETYRIPVDGTFTSGWVRQMSVLIVDFDENARLAHEFIFGDDYYDKQNAANQ